MIGAAPLVLDGTVPAERIAALHPAGIVDAGHDTVVQSPLAGLPRGRLCLNKVIY